ncbi:hypothetical protein C7446_2329 [Kushneria sinocarnis]|uniref:Uncharacterized protein n=1 Tax=Kushneria sinocarnis TaxID=595502 RepID=A0A420WVK5_9GAMM|nr:hypothetical protein [Kushneria sinocarnis]RKR02611.1 hypothetical protein C7446_2329 [Kushneria sinocarnis]
MNPLKMLRGWRTGGQVLGHDCDGKPLRAGDIVEPALPDDEVVPEFRCRMTVERISQADAGKIIVSTPDGLLGKGWPRYLRKIEGDSDDAGSWQAIGEQTGWQPRAVEAPEEVGA